MQSILNNYAVLRDLWIESLDAVKNTEMKARIQGVSSQMDSFEYFYGVSFGNLILRHSDNLSRTLQKADISAAEGQEAATMSLQTLKSLRLDANFKLFWTKVTRMAETLQVSEPRLPRHKKVPRRLDDGDADTNFPTSPEDHYRRIYFEALDLITTCITSRFNQPGFREYQNVQELLLSLPIV